MNITTSNNTATTGTTTTSTTGTLTVGTSTNSFLYTGRNMNAGNTFNYQPYTTTWTYPNLSMNNREHLKQLRIIKRALRRNKVYASAGTICRQTNYYRLI
jgi:hypothetical protein